MTPIERANRRTVLEALTALSAADYAGYLAKMADDVRFHIVGGEGRGGDILGRQALWDQVLSRSTQSIGEGGFRETILCIIAEGDWVVCESVGEEKTKTGEAYNNEYLCFFRLEAGAIAEVRYYLDSDLTRRVKGL